MGELAQRRTHPAAENAWNLLNTSQAQRKRKKNPSSQMNEPGGMGMYAWDAFFGFASEAMVYLSGAVKGL